MTLTSTGTEQKNAAGTGAKNHGIVPDKDSGGRHMGKLVWDEAGEGFACDSLYFIADDAAAAVKIGRGNALKRLGSLQIGNPRPLRLIAEIPNAGWQEAFWHIAWEIWKVRGEWFDLTTDLAAAIESIAAGGDWTDHVPPLYVPEDGSEVDEGEWREHMLDAFDAYCDVAQDARPLMPLIKAAEWAIHDPDFDGRCLMTRFVEAGGGTFVEQDTP